MSNTVTPAMYLEAINKKLAEYSAAPDVPLPSVEMPLHIEAPTFQPPAAELARALFDTDPEVKAYAETRCDWGVQLSETKELQLEGRPRVATETWQYNFKKLDAAMDACWRVNDKGFRAKCEARAKEMVEVLGR